jgi:TRAP-type uncharacterized transport system fused permease subunit
MPPIMGAAAFVMAEFLRSATARSSLGADPGGALLRRLLRAVHFEAKRAGWSACRAPNAAARRRDARARPPVHPRRHHPGDDVPATARRWRRWSARSPASRSPCCASPRARAVTLRNIIEALVDGANALSVALACACAGIIIGVVTLSGSRHHLHAVRHRRSRRYAGARADPDHAIAGIVLGMGMPTTPAYIIMTSRCWCRRSSSSA